MIHDEKVYDALQQFQLSCGYEARYIDLVSEIGELGKELLKGSDYHKSSLRVSASTVEEMGDCLFSIIALCQELSIDPDDALVAAIQKYQTRYETKGSIGSDTY